MTAGFRITLPLFLLLTMVFSSAVRGDPYEEIFGDVEDEEVYMSLLNQLDTITRSPVNLLEAKPEDLARLPWVSPWLAREIVALRARGELTSLDDILKIDGVDRRLVELLRPFVVVLPPAKREPPLEANLRSRVIASPVADCYKDVKTYARVGATYSRYEAGLLAEKDRGESQLNDLQTAFAGMRLNWGRLIVGDFILVSGHGLVFSNPYGFSPSTVDPWRFSQGDFGIKPYTSVDENFAFRGLALEYDGKHAGLCLAFSRARFDAALDEDGSVASLGTTGYHIDSEGEDELREDLLGLALRYAASGLGLGLDASLSRRNRAFAISRLDWMDESWKAAGSCDLALLWDNTAFFVQGALAEGYGAGLAGFGYDRHKLEFLILGRYYSEHFFSLHARPFAFYSGYATGERGVLTRLAFRPFGKALVSVGNDLHERRVEERGLAEPSGSESFLDVEVPLGDLTLSLGEKLLLSEDPPERPDDPTESRSRLRSRVDVRYGAARWLEIRARYENLRYREDESGGVRTSKSDLLRLDLSLEVTRRAAVKIGFHTFAIGSYGARIYQYEPGLPFYPALEMLKSDGSRWYTVLSFDMAPWGKLAAKYAVTAYTADEYRAQFMAYYSARL